MKAVSNNEGRTVLFVSHNMAAVKSLCSSGILLKNGIIQLIGNATDIVSAYLKGDSESENRKMFDGGYNNEDFNLKEISFNPKGETFNAILDEYQEIEINIKIDIKQMAERRKITFVLNNEEGEPIFTFSHSSSGISLKNGFNHLICFLPKGFLNVGTYYLSFYLIQDSKESIFIEKDIISFGIQVGERGIGSWMGNEPGFIKPIFNWQSIN